MGVCFNRVGARIVNKKQSKAVRKGYREAGQLYWSEEMSAMIKGKNRALAAYRAGFIASLAFAMGVAFLYARAFW